MKILVLGVGACLAFAPDLAAQRSEGLLVGTPLMSVVAPGTSVGGVTLDSTAFHRRRAGFDDWLAEAPGDDPGDPDFTWDAMFGPSAADVRLNAFSLGLDDVFATIPVDGESEVLFGSEGWGVLGFSVSRGTVGDPGSLIETEALAPGGAGGDLFTYIPFGSELGVPLLADNYPIDEVQRAADSGQLGFSGMPELSGLDLFAPLYEAGSPAETALPNDPRVFFSVAQATLGSAPASWFAGSTPSAASILTCQWNPGAGTWSEPEVFISYEELDLLVTDDVDALAVDYVDCRLIFSVVHRDGFTPDHLRQVAWVDTSSETGVVLTGLLMTIGAMGKEGVARRLQMGVAGEVDGVCTEDPAAQAGSPSLLAFGRPVARVSPFVELATNTYRDDDDPMGPRVSFVVAGASNTPGFPETLTLWTTLRFPGGGSIGPRLIYLDPLGPGTPPTRTFSVAAPELAILLGVELDAFWMVFGGPYKRSSPVVRLDI